MLAAGGGGRSEKEKDRETEIITNQRDCARSARDGVEWGRSGGPSREERGGGKWHEPRETRPQCGHPTRPKPPSLIPTPPTHERDTAPLPTQIPEETQSPPPHGQTHRPETPWARHSPPSQRSPTWRRPLRGFLLANKPTQHQETAPAPSREEMAPEPGPSGERGIPAPLGEKTT